MSSRSSGRGPLRSGWVTLSGALVLYRIRLRRRWFQELLAVLGIALGVALLYATQVASTSLSGPVRSLNQGIVGNSQLQLIARGGAGMPQAIYGEVIALPGVRRAAPILEKPGNLVGPRGQQGVTLYGGDPRILSLRGNLLQGFSRRDAAQQESIIVSAPIGHKLGVRVGDDVELQLDGRRVIVPAVVAGREQIGPLVDTTITLMPLAYLQRLSRSRGRVTRILVEAQPGQTAAVRQRLQRLARGRADVRPADYETQLFEAAAKPTSQASVIFSALSALVGWLFAVCALLVTAAERRKLAGQQREQGFAPSATLTTLLVDAAVIGLVGSAIGLVAGELLSRRGFSSDVSFLSGAFPIGDQRVVTWQSVAIAAIGGLLAAIVGVLGPVRDVAAGSLPGRVRRTPRVGRQEARRRRVTPLAALGVACLAAAVTITIAIPTAAIVGLILLALALLMLLPTLLVGAIRGLEWCNRRGHSIVSIELALQQLREARWRSRALAIAATGAVAVFGSTALQGARVNLQDGLGASSSGMASVADIWAAPAGAGSSIGTASFEPRATASLARLHGVASVGLYRAGLLDVADRRAWVFGEPSDVAHPIRAGQLLDGDGQLAARRIRSGGWAAVSKALAESLGVHVGERLVLPTPRPIELPRRGDHQQPGVVERVAHPQRHGFRACLGKRRHRGLSPAARARCQGGRRRPGGQGRPRPPRGAARGDGQAASGRSARVDAIWVVSPAPDCRVVALRGGACDERGDDRPAVAAPAVGCRAQAAWARLGADVALAGHPDRRAVRHRCACGRRVRAAGAEALHPRSRGLHRVPRLRWPAA